MKFLFIAGDVNRIGGIEKYNSDFYYALKNTGARTTLVERREGGVLAKLSFLHGVIWQYFKVRPDIIFCGHLNFSPICFILEKIFGTPYTLALYGIEIIETHSWLKRKSVIGASKIITISGYARELILKQYPKIAESIFMLPSAVDGAIFQIRSKNQNLLDKFGIADRPTIISLARLSTQEYKGQDRVLASLPYVLEKIPKAIYLVVGGGTDERVQTVLEKHPELVNSVIFTGRASNEERVDFYNLGDVFALPTKFEGFGIVFIESLACGVPVIASDAYGCREGLLNGELGLLVPPDDLRAIADAIVKILDRKASKTLFDRDFLRRKTLEVYGIDTWMSSIKTLIESLGFSQQNNKSRN